jgi:hypothetical protein
MSLDICFDRPQEGEKLLIPIAAPTLHEHTAVGDVERGEERHGRVLDVVMLMPSTYSSSSGSIGCVRLCA